MTRAVLNAILTFHQFNRQSSIIEFSNGTGIGIPLDYKKAAAYKASQEDNPPVDGNIG